MSIGHDWDAMGDGTLRAAEMLPAGPNGKPAGPRVDPRLAAAVEDTAAQGKARQDKVGDRIDRTSKYTAGLRDIDGKGDRAVKGVTAGASTMPPMPTIPSSAPPAPTMAAAVPAVPAMPSPGGGATAPSGIGGIAPQLLAALVALTQAGAAEEAADGMFPELRGDPWSSDSAHAPQNPQPLGLSQVSLAKYPGGPLSAGETAAVIDQALTINGVPNDPSLRAQWQELYQHMAAGESSRNPNAANNTDSNATGPIVEDGSHSNSSRGMWQCIPSTFAAYHMAGTSNSIYDPVASAAASINYVMHTYHVSPDGENLADFAAHRGVGTAGYRGY